MMISQITVSAVLLLATTVQADFTCICNYNIESAVYASTSKGSTIGYMYEFDCKPEGPPSNDPNLVTIQYEQKYGYLEKGQGIETQVCPGAPSETDVVTTTKTMSTLAPTTTTFITTTTTTPKPTTTTTLPTTTTTPIPTTTTPLPTTSATTTPKPTTTVTKHTTNTTPLPTTTETPQLKTSTTTTPIPTTTTQPITTTTPRSTPTTTTTTPNPTTTTQPTNTTTQPPTTTTTRQTTTTTPNPTTTTTTHRNTHVHTTPTTTTSSVRPYTQVQYGCPKQYFQHAQQVHGTLFTLDSRCYVIVPTLAIWRDAEADCLARGGHLAHIPDQRHQDAIYQVTSQHLGQDLWIGLNDRNQEQHYAWSSGDPVIYTNWINGHADILRHEVEDCAELGAESFQGRWNDVECSRKLSYLCEFRATMTTVFATTTPMPQVSYTDVQYGCPKQYFQHAHQVHGTLFTLDSNCYEIVPTLAIWRDAEADCLARGGHLAHIPDQRHQDAIYQVTSQHLGQDLWIGLNDRNQEQHYAWSSGDPVIYIKWIGGNEDILSHDVKDCVKLVAESFQGRWNDVECSMKLSYLCEFKISSSHGNNVFVG